MHEVTIFTSKPFSMNNTVLPPFHVITATDKRGLIIIITTFSTVSVWVCLLLRIYMRLKVNGPWKWDDTCVAGATAIAAIRSAVVYIAVASGFGRSIHLLPLSVLSAIGKERYTDAIFFVLSMVLSKYAVSALCLRLTWSPNHARVIWTTSFICTIWGVIALLLLVVDCRPGDIYKNKNRCKNVPIRWMAVTTVDILTEIMLFLIPAYLALQLQMASHLKGVVFLAFGVRIPVIAASVAHTYCLVRALRSTDPTLLGAYTACWRQVQLDYSIIASTLTCVGAFLSPFKKEVITTMGDSGQQRSDYVMGLDDFSGKQNEDHNFTPTVYKKGFPLSPSFRPDGVQPKTIISSRRRSDICSISSKSSQQGIMLQVEWEVENNRKDSRDDGMEIKSV
ncbi:hypothetical protein PVAG01_08501 [Phlyctema vagabunda]|uniref:Rhodopsin domain-containing protein n=1 Tax=Phlyctema vagabunda TaxID=108571 RepID=A0ABR4P9L0_9HELO